MNANIEKILSMTLASLAIVLSVSISSADDNDWVNNLEPIPEHEWDYAKARHLIERGGFGDNPKNIERLVSMGPRAAVR